MENLQHENLCYELLYTRFQAIKPSTPKNLLLKTLCFISRGDASGSSSVISPVSEVKDSQLASSATAYEQDCRRVALFYRSQHQQLWNALLELVSLLRRKADFIFNHPTATEAPFRGTVENLEKLTTLRALLDALGDKAVALDSFAKANVDAAAELAMVADSKIASASLMTLSSEFEMMSKTEYATAAESALLGVLPLDPIILGLSDAYALLHAVEEADTNTAESSSLLSSVSSRWVAPQKFKRTTRKFWLKLSDVSFFKIQVIKHLPILVYENRRKITKIDPLDLPFTLPSVIDADSSPVSSVYLDSPSVGFPSYYSRLRREDGATAVRLRWYGERNPEDPFQQVFVEKKVHVVSGTTFTNEATSSGGGGGGGGGNSAVKSSNERREGQSESEKQRISLPQSQIPALLSGHPVAVPPTFSKDDYEFLQAVQMYILEDSHVPVLRTCYDRTAFQCDDHNKVRISMDTNLRMVRDYIPSISSTSSNFGGGDGGGGTNSFNTNLHHWCRSDADIASSASSPKDTIHFPYAVVEVKLQVNPPEWLQNLVRQKILLPVPKFSKFLHGTAMLYQLYVENVPHWFLPNSSAVGNGDDKEEEEVELPLMMMTPASWEEMIEPSAEAVSDAAAWLFPAMSSDSLSGSMNENEQKEKETRVTQVKPGLLWRWRKDRGAVAAGVRTPLINAPPSSNTTITTTLTLTTNTTSGGHGSNGDGKHSAPSTPDGASPRAELLLLPSNDTLSPLQNQVMLAPALLNTDTSSDSGIAASELTNRSIAGGLGGGLNGGGLGSRHRCLSSSPTSSASLPSLVSSSAEGVTNNHPVLVEKLEQQQQQQQRPVTQLPTPWHVFQDPTLSPVAALHQLPIADLVDTPTMAVLQNGNNEADLERGATATTTTTTKPASRKASLVHLVSSISGLGGINPSKNSNTTSSPAAEVATKTPPAVALANDDDDELTLKKDSSPPLLPSFSIISSPSSTLSGRNRGNGTFFSPSSTLNPPRAMVRTRVEPKTFFANERTFLQWLQISVLVMFLGLNLLK
jgi:SPX domain protein involved in polyphosphate accumulation